LNPNKKSAHKDVKRRGAALMGGILFFIPILSAAGMRPLSFIDTQNGSLRMELPS